MKKINKENGDTIFDPAMRTFFILATIAAIYYLVLWTAYYTFKLKLNFVSMSPLMWHAHEMLFGYTAAVIAGFLLTIERYWS
ncbi:MAG: NnrS family protein, partial [Candidatus Dadabacteria bacterium]|nr:NnrS family protein [Candidatus Dadabacteria bacterium]